MPVIRTYYAKSLPKLKLKCLKPVSLNKWIDVAWKFIEMTGSKWFRSMTDCNSQQLNPNHFIIFSAMNKFFWLFTVSSDDGIFINFTFFCNFFLIFKTALESTSRTKLRTSGETYIRAKSRTLRMTFVVVFAFLLCWTPYTIASLVHFIIKPRWTIFSS